MPKVRRHRSGVQSDERITISQTILDYVVERNEGVLTSNARDDDRWDAAKSILRMGVREAICVPMQGRYDVVGVIYIDTSITPQRMLQQGSANKFKQEHLKLMIAIAHQAALAIEDTNYYKAMVQAERLAAVGQTIASLSHHIKNILQGVRGGSYLIEMGMKDHAKAIAAGQIDVDTAEKAVGIMRKGWGIVEKNQERISALVMDMLTFSKEREPVPEPANLNELVTDAVELMKTRATEATVELDWLPAPTMPTLMFDPECDAPGDSQHHHQRHRRLPRPRRGPRRSFHTIQPRRADGPRRGRRQRQRHRKRRPRKNLRRLRLAQRRPRHRPGPARQPKDPRRARRPHPRRKQTRRRQPLHARIPRRLAAVGRHLTRPDPTRPRQHDHRSRPRRQLACLTPISTPPRSALPRSFVTSKSTTRSARRTTAPPSSPAIPDIELPALIAARHQTAGRGRGKNIWWSADGALTFSILLEPAALGISTANWPQLSLATAVAVCDALSNELSSQIQQRSLAIKWPNDVMLDGAKLGGILIESPGGASPAKDRLIIGIGININNSWNDQAAARGLAQHGPQSPRVTALSQATNRSHNLQHVLCETLRALVTRINQLASSNPQLPVAWQQLCWLTEQSVEVQSNGKVIDGRCLGIAGDGTLLVQDIFGIHNINSGSVRLR